MPSHSKPRTTIPLTTYLYTRLSQFSCKTLHGVPGDYNLTALDYLNPTSNFSGLTWAANCNELNAGYAADGYSRIRGLGALITAFGVGELSALNAIGGAYAEQAAVVHIVGTPPRAAQRAGLCLHHSLGDGDFGVFARMAEMVTVAQCRLVDEATAAEEVDRVLRECVIQSQPVYLELPTDMVNCPVDAERLERLIDVSVVSESEEVEEEVVRRVMERVVMAKQPFVMIDGFTSRWSIFDEIDRLVRVLGWPTTSTPFGKSCVDETLPNFHGIYAGIAGRSVYKPWVDACDLVLRFGGLDSDVNTYGFSTLPPEKATINVHRDHVVFGGGDSSGGTKKIVQNVQIKSLLHRLTAALKTLDDAAKDGSGGGGIPRMSPYPSHLGDPRAELAALGKPDPNSPIEQHDFWRRISLFFREGDVILTETGTPSVGSREFVLPKNARLVNSSIWLSIGYMLAAAQGAAMAVREIRQEEEDKGHEVVAGRRIGKKEDEREDVTGQQGKREREEEGEQGPDLGRRRSNNKSVLSTSTASGRTILFEGDGSFQMTAQELSTIIRHELDLTLFLINNDGYTIERFIHGMQASYNDVAPWRYLDAPYFFGAKEDSLEKGDGVETKAGEDDAAGGDHVSNNLNGSSSSSPPPTRAQPAQSQKTTKAKYRIQTHQARTWGELNTILAKPSVQSGRGLCMIEVFMDREDAPESLKRLVANVRRRNSGESTDREDEEGVVGREKVKEKEAKAVEEKVMKAAG